MPIYEFVCQQCGKDSEILTRTSDWKGSACPHCGSKKLTKKLSVFAPAGGEEAASEAGPMCSGNPGACGRCGPG